MSRIWEPVDRFERRMTRVVNRYWWVLALVAAFVLISKGALTH